MHHYSGLLSLQEIHLGANQLKQIPQSLAKLEFLTYINLYQNFVTVLPDSFEDLPSFCEPRPEIGSSSRQLILSYNRFETFPPQLLKLRCLHELHFSGNAVPEIPDGELLLPPTHFAFVRFVRVVRNADRLGRTTEIKNLSRLMLLSLGNNRIPLKLPESLGKLQICCACRVPLALAHTPPLPPVSLDRRAGLAGAALPPGHPAGQRADLPAQAHSPTHRDRRLAR
jgi:Leucine-rich repeat (LRR) protein